MKIAIGIISIFLAMNTVGFAQKTIQHPKKTEIQSAKFSCPMHKKVGSDKPGKCAKCGMKLVENVALKQNQSQKHNPVQKAKQKEYECSMCNLAAKKLGKCPNCGMAMTLKNK